MTTRFGILPYDTTDDSVVVRCPLTSLASITDLGGIDLSTENNVFDSVLGMSPRVNGSNISGIRLRLSLMTLESGAHDNLPSGQFSIEVQRAALAIPASVVDSESAGYDNGANNMAFLYWVPDNIGAGQAGYLYKRYSTTNYDIYVKAGAGATAAGAKYIGYQDGMDEWCTVTVSWTPTLHRVYIDGFQIHETTRIHGSNQATQFGDLYIGNYGNSAVAVASWNNPYYMRNFIMSSKPVVFHQHPVLANLFSVGDSFASGQYGNTTTTTGEAGSETNLIVGALRRSGFTVGGCTVYANGGSNVLDSGADPMQSDINAAGKTRAQGAAEFPTFVIFQGGTNDSGQVLTNFLADLKDHVEEWMGAGSYTANYRGQRMILVCQVSGTSISAGLTNVHNYIKQIPAWWDATYPSRAGQVQYVDMVPYLTTDGTTVDTQYYNAADPVHPNSVANVVYARVIANKMLQMLEV